MMKTKLTEMLGLKYPIIQSGMSQAAFPPLVAALAFGAEGIAMGTRW